MTACSLVRLLILRQHSKFFSVVANLATNSLGLVAKGLFTRENISIPFMSISQKTLKNNTELEIALNTFCFII